MSKLRSRSLSRTLLHLSLVALLGVAAGCADEDGFRDADVAGGDASPGEDATISPAPEVAIAYVNEWEDGGPVHDGERVTIQGIALVNSGVIVSGRYLKFHVQDETGGVAIFADTDATLEEAGYDGSVFADLFVRRGDEVRVTGTVSAHSGLVEFLPTEPGAVEILSHGNPLPEPLAFENAGALIAAGRAPIGSLVKVSNLTLTEEVAWPPLGEKAKGLVFADSDTPADQLGADIYQASGIPGAPAPVGPFSMQGLCRVDGDLVQVFPRDIADLEPVANELDGSVRVSRQDDPEWGYDVDISTLPAFLYQGRSAVLFYALLDPDFVPAPQDFAYKNVARDGRQPFLTIDHVQARQAMFVQSLDDDDQPIAGSLDTLLFESLDLSAIHFLNDVNELRLFPVDATGPEIGEAACEEGINVHIQGEVFHVPFDELQTQSVELDGQAVEAVPLEAILSDDILGRYSFDGFLGPEHIRALYDYHLDAESEEGPVLTPEALAAAWYVPADGTVRFSDESLAPAEAVPAGLCHLVAERRFIVRREGASATVRLGQLAEITATMMTPDGEGSALPVSGIIERAGLVAEGEAMGAFNYRLIPPDFPAGMLFPWSHGHLDHLYWWDAGLKTFSTDTVGDLLDADGVASFGGVANSGWSSVKAMLYLDLEPLVDAGGDLIDPEYGNPDHITDPASCTGCHAKRGNVVIPVSCGQCH